MRNLTALLLLLSLCSLDLVSSQISGTEVLITCCARPTKVRIPLKNIVTYWRTSSCPKQAIVFQMLNKSKNTTREVCVDPTAVWVDSHMRKVDLKNKVGSSLSAEGTSGRDLLPSFQTRNVTAKTTRTVCVDPTAVWVDSHMRKVDLKNKVGSSLSLDVLKTCCRSTTKAKIPLKNIVTYWKTGSSCPLQAIVFKTVNGRMYCVDPAVSWVSCHMKSVDARKNPKSKP